MKLVGLDEEIKAAILARDKSASGLSAKAAIAMVK
jgi:hypothetical protein